MTQEEKAKAYDEALERAKEHINSKGIGDTVDLCKHLFSELRESEDERVIRTLYYLVRDHDWLNGATKEEVLAWLEKQKESLHIPETCKENADSFTSEDEGDKPEILDYHFCEPKDGDGATDAPERYSEEVEL